ncbi:MAG: thiol-disulfide oxidoreductase DCC family protein [Mariniblastus sp.]
MNSIDNSATVQGDAKPQPHQAADLQTPQQLPNADVVIFDGQCVFCTKQVKNLKFFDGKNRLSFVSLHDSFVAEHFPDLSFEQMMKQIYVIPNSPNGYTSDRYGGAAALRYLTRRLPRLWIAAPLLHIPFTLPIVQWVYSQIAKRRYKIAGKSGPVCDENGTCELHFGDRSKKD